MLTIELSLKIWGKEFCVSRQLKLGFFVSALQEGIRSAALKEHEYQIGSIVSQPNERKKIMQKLKTKPYKKIKT